MKTTIPLILMVFGTLSANSQMVLNDKSQTAKPPVEINSQINPKWDLWKQKGYNYGFMLDRTPVPISFNAPIMTNSTIMVRGQSSVGKRWGLHCFEAYADDDTSRLTMLVNKHVEENKDVAEIYYYASKYGHGDQTYNWVKIGSDVRGHSYMFSRDRAIFYGSLELENAITLGNIGLKDIRSSAPKGDDESNYKESAKYAKYKALKRAKDGTIYFDRDKKMVLVKIDGKWCKVAVKPLEGYELSVLAEGGSDIRDSESQLAAKEILLTNTKLSAIEKYAKNFPHQLVKYKRNQSNLAVLTKSDIKGCLHFKVYENAFEKSEFLAFEEYRDMHAVRSRNSSGHTLAALKREAEQTARISKKTEHLTICGEGKGSEFIKLSGIILDKGDIPDFKKASAELISDSQGINIKLYWDFEARNEYLLIERYPNKEECERNAKSDAYKKWETACEKLVGFSKSVKEIEVAGKK